MDRIDELEKAHAQELKDLEAEIEKLRSSLKKAGKAQKKGINAKIETMKRVLEVRQEEEMYRLNLELQEQEQKAVSVHGSELIEITQVPEQLQAPEKINNIASENKRKSSRHQKKKDRKTAALQKTLDEAEEEAKNIPNLRKIEDEAIDMAASALKLKVHQIPPDGHCLYNSISDQLLLRHGLQAPFSHVRKKASEYLLSHRDDFLPFITSEDGDFLTEEKYNKYCHDVANTATWGGQIEISALSKAYEIPIVVLQKDSSVEIGKEEFPETEPLKISYHRHAYGLGCHYNSLRPTSLEGELQHLEI